jgi:uncharacterized protein YdiU (UPF0061 family)
MSRKLTPVDREAEPEYIGPDEQPEQPTAHKEDTTEGLLPATLTNLSDNLIDYSVEFDRLQERVEDALKAKQKRLEHSVGRFEKALDQWGDDWETKLKEMLPK